MKAKYDKLWVMLDRKKVSKEKIRHDANISKEGMKLLERNLSVPDELLFRICKVLDCDFNDIVEIVEGKKRTKLDKNKVAIKNMDIAILIH
jgi:DNA-binding Xre family transcriptional regulator